MHHRYGSTYAGPVWQCRRAGRIQRVGIYMWRLYSSNSGNDDIIPCMDQQTGLTLVVPYIYSEWHAEKTVGNIIQSLL